VLKNVSFHVSIQLFPSHQRIPNDHGLGEQRYRFLISRKNYSKNKYSEHTRPESLKKIELDKNY
jgi:hypothetical protein